MLAMTFDYHEEQSDLGLHCLLRPICPNTSNYYGSIFIQSIISADYRWALSNRLSIIGLVNGLFLDCS